MPEMRVNVADIGLIIFDMKKKKSGQKTLQKQTVWVGKSLQAFIVLQSVCLLAD